MLIECKSIKDFRKPLLKDETRIYFCKIKNGSGLGKSITNETIKTNQMKSLHKRTKYFIKRTSLFTMIYIFRPQKEFGVSFCNPIDENLFEGYKYRISDMPELEARKSSYKEVCKALGGRKNLKKAHEIMKKKGS